MKKSMVLPLFLAVLLLFGVMLPGETVLAAPSMTCSVKAGTNTSNPFDVTVSVSGVTYQLKTANVIGNNFSSGTEIVNLNDYESSTGTYAYTFAFSGVTLSPEAKSADISVVFTPASTSNGEKSITLTARVANINMSSSGGGGKSDNETTSSSSSSQPEAPKLASFELLTEKAVSVKAGTTADVNLTLYNKGDAESGAITAFIKDESGKLETKESSQFSPIKKGQSDALSFKIAIPQTLARGRYNVNLVIRYDDGSRKKVEQTLPFQIDVASDVVAKALEISQYSIDQPTARNGLPFTLSMTLQNNTGVNLDNAQITLQGLDGTKFGMNQGLTSRNVSIKKGESLTLEFPLIGCEGISSIREVIPVKLEYYLDPLNIETKQEPTYSVSIPCTPEEKSSNSEDDLDQKFFSPSIIIDNYSFGGDHVIGGKVFPLSLSFRNTSTDTTILNLKVTIQGAAGSGEKGVAYSPANSSNNFFFSELSPGSSNSINLDIKAKADAVPDSYPIEVIFEYEYKLGKKMDKQSPVTNTITIPLQQDDRLTLNPPQIDQESYVGQECSVNATLVNKGKSAVYNVTVTVEGEGFEKTSGSYYIGNIESGKEEYYDTRIIPSSAGDVKGEIVISYEDGNGEAKEIREEFITNAMEMNHDMNGGLDINGGMLPGEDMPTDGKPSGLPTWALVLIIAGGVVIVGGVVLLIVLKKKKKKKLMEIEDDDADH